MGQGAAVPAGRWGHRKKAKYQRYQQRTARSPPPNLKGNSPLCRGKPEINRRIDGGTAWEYRKYRYFIHVIEQHVFKNSSRLNPNCILSELYIILRSMAGVVSNISCAPLRFKSVYVRQAVFYRHKENASGGMFGRFFPTRISAQPFYGNKNGLLFAQNISTSGSKQLRGRKSSSSQHTPQHFT